MPDRLVRPGALWQLGFRPFYLLASGFGALSIGLWALQFTGWLPLAYLPSPLWHAHEMLFGFTLAVVVGFLLTAGSNWTGRPTLRGGPLAALALLIPFVAAGNRRNYFFVALLVLLGAATLAVHLGLLGLAVLPAWLGIQVALDVVLFILAVMGGRVIPMFTNNGVPGAGAQRHPIVEKLALGSVLALLAADTLPLPAGVPALLAAAAGAAHLARWVLWRPWNTLRTPLVWVLHLAYAWIPAHLLLRAAASAGWIAPSLAVHALTTGAIGGLVIGMMTRTARGHTARPLRADGWDVACYLLVLAAAAVRVLLPLAAPTWLLEAVIASGALWSAGFGLYAVRYAPFLTRPRLDGKPG